MGYNGDPNAHTLPELDIFPADEWYGIARALRTVPQDGTRGLQRGGHEGRHRLDPGPLGGVRVLVHVHLCARGGGRLPSNFVVAE